MDQIKGGSTSGMPSTFTILGDNFRFAPSPSALTQELLITLKNLMLYQILIHPIIF